jgi:hypothetical protein
MLSGLLLPDRLLIRCRVSVVFSVQSWLAETQEQKKTSTTPAYFSVGMAGTYSNPILQLC